MLRAWPVVLIVGCSPRNDDVPPPAPPPVVADAGVDGITTIVGFDPASGMHLDDDSGSAKTPAAKRPKGPGVPIGIMLRSDPTGATVIVDGENLGETPKYWSGIADGSDHLFVFSKKEFGLAQYRIIPIQSGVLFATLLPVSVGDVPDAGFPQTLPDAAPAKVAPPPTVLKPDAAAPVDPYEPGSASGAGPNP